VNNERPLRLVAQDGLAIISEYREAARRLLRSDLTIEGRQIAVMRLYQRGKREPFADVIVGAIVAEVVWSIERDDVDALRSAGDRMERAHRSLRARGYDRCPECLCELSRELDWSRWHAARQGASAEYQAREGAVT
jgi:hypothetical protein